MVIESLRNLKNAQDGHYKLYIPVDGEYAISGDFECRRGKIIYAYVGVNNEVVFEIKRGIDEPISLEEFAEKLSRL